MKELNLKSGYTFDYSLGAVYRFDPVSQGGVDTIVENKEARYVVETVTTRPAAAAGGLRLKRYLTLGFRDALTLAMRIEGFAADTGEEAVGIRPATPEEAEKLERVYDYYIKDSDPRAMGEDLEIV